MKKISQKTIERGVFYIRTLEALLKDGQTLISSNQLANITGFSDAQIRKDISSFGKVGRPGIGYSTAELRNILQDFVLKNEVVHVALFGVGSLGAAILKYPGFHKDGIKLVAAFDKMKNKVGATINGVKVYDPKRAVDVIKKTHADIGVIAVPKEHSQEVADIIVLSGLRGIVNFSPISIAVPKNVMVKNIDLRVEFFSLFCNMQYNCGI
ncbi:MAG: redox-sensing transcriptional repressor Rex [Candidatus Omnitrophica bacterium]|nr:redox-sensing transcriptional repressor Rex [Candidatus Omnitrophota bacterium]MBU4478581.1 redox-sensing transcriptional repressor Rex [Candidatus Omnitrophota bacterium]